MIYKGEDVFQFEPNSSGTALKVPPQFLQGEKQQTLGEFLEQHKTVAFIVIKNDMILMEEYFNGYAPEDIINSFSVTKSFVSALVGIAIEEGLIRSADQPITDFLPELAKNDPRFGKITLDHLLNMRSGIKFNEGYANPFADMAKYYYGTNLRKYITQLKIERQPNEAYNYISANTQLLGMALERATGKSMAAWLEEKIWKQAGMTYNATWSMDSKRNRQIKAFCCLNARPVDLAKFGRLYLNDGQHNGKQIIPKEWVAQTMTIINDSRDSQGYPYTRHWRVKEDGAIFAKGILGQYIYVFPEKNIIIVRMGKKEGDIIWAEFLEKLCDQIND